jgi:hypothetical protein
VSNRYEASGQRVEHPRKAMRSRATSSLHRNELQALPTASLRRRPRKSLTWPLLAHTVRQVSEVVIVVALLGFGGEIFIRSFFPPRLQSEISGVLPNPADVSVPAQLSASSELSTASVLGTVPPEAAAPAPITIPDPVAVPPRVTVPHTAPEQVAIPPSILVPDPLTAPKLAKVPTVRPAPTRKPVPPRLTVRVSTTTPRRARGFWVTVVVPNEVNGKDTKARIHFHDARGKSYHLTLTRSQRSREWTRCFSLEKTGRWRGVAILQAGQRKLTAPLPPFRVIP